MYVEPDLNGKESTLSSAHIKSSNAERCPIEIDDLSPKQIMALLRHDPATLERAILHFLYDPIQLAYYVPSSDIEEEKNGQEKKNETRAVVQDTDKQANLPNRGKTGWKEAESIRRVRFLTSFFVGEKTRRSGNVYECTHFLETASVAANLGADLPYFKENGINAKDAREILTYAGYAHDLVEDFGKEFPFLTAEFIVEHTWRGNPEHKDLLVYLLQQMTDPPELEGKEHKAERLALQVKRANEDRTGIVGILRLADKYTKLNRDIEAHEADPELYPAENVIRSATTRLPFVLQMNVSKKFHIFQEALESFIEKVKSPLAPAFSVSMRQFGGSMGGLVP